MPKALQQNYRDPKHFTEAHWLNFDEFRGDGVASHEPIEKSDLPLPVVRLDFEGPADFFRAGRARVVSEKLRTEIDRFTDNQIQYYQIELLNPTDTRCNIQCYFLAHLGLQIDCFDYDRSDYDRADDGYIERIRKPVLREDAIGDAHVFWVANTSSLPFWMVSDEFAAHMEATDLTGMLFLDLDEVKMLS